MTLLLVDHGICKDFAMCALLSHKTRRENIITDYTYEYPITASHICSSFVLLLHTDRMCSLLPWICVFVFVTWMCIDKKMTTYKCTRQAICTTKDNCVNNTYIDVQSQNRY